MKKDKKQYDKTLYQKLNTFADWVIRLVMINILIIVTSLPVITLYPALLAGYKMFHKYINKEEVPIFKSYFTYFGENFGSKIKIGLILAAAIFVGAVNTTIYNEFLEANPSPFNLVGQYVMIIMVLSVIFVTMYTFPLMLTYPNTNVWLLIKFSFFLSGKFILRTFLAILILFIPILLLVHPLLILILVFVGMSTMVLLYALVFRKVVEYVEGLDQANV
jgi:uncharacterized membrane protein YesL